MSGLACGRFLEQQTYSPLNIHLKQYRLRIELSGQMLVSMLKSLSSVLSTTEIKVKSKIQCGKQ